MSRIRITHTTTYNYAAPVGFGLHRLVLRPRAGHDNQVESLSLAIEPDCVVSWHRDLFGNSIAMVRFLKKADLLSIVSDVVVFRGDHFSHHSLLELLPVTFPLKYSPLEEPLITGYLSPVYPEEAVNLKEWLLSTFSIHDGVDAVALVQEMGLWIYRTIKYRRRDDRGVQTPLQTLTLKSGSCRDMATLLLEAARSIGLPGRFASGYLDSASSAAGRASTHAWTEIYFPEHGWFGFDPTLGEGSSQKHIVTGVSSHPRGVMPITGAYSGPPELYLGMSVSVKIEQLDVRETPSVIQAS